MNHEQSNQEDGKIRTPRGTALYYQLLRSVAPLGTNETCASGVYLLTNVDIKPKSGI